MLIMRPLVLRGFEAKLSTPTETLDMEKLLEFLQQERGLRLELSVLVVPPAIPCMLATTCFHPCEIVPALRFPVRAEPIAPARSTEVKGQ